MTVLRSREVLPTVIPKIQQPMEIDVLEPATPAKDVECVNQLPDNTAPSSVSVSQDCGSKVFGSSVSGENAIVRRRSARLAMNLVAAEVVTGKGKEVEHDHFDGGLDVENFDCSLVKDSMSGGLHQNSGDGVRNDEVGPSGVELARHGNRKRRLSSEVGSLGLLSNLDENTDKECLRLRSGKKILKKEMKLESGDGDVSLEEAENCRKSGVFLPTDIVLGLRCEADKQESFDFCWAVRRPRSYGLGKTIDENLINNDSVLANGRVHVHHNVKGPGELVEAHAYCESDTGVKTRGRLSEEKEEEMKLENNDPRLTIEEKGKMVFEVDDSTSSSSEESDFETENVRLTREEKGKAVLEDLDPNSSEEESDLETRNARGIVSSTNPQAEGNEAVQARREEIVGGNRNRIPMIVSRGRGGREGHRDIARRIASRFAHFSSQQGFDDRLPNAPQDIPLAEADQPIEDWPGPFSTAMKIIRDRATNKNEEHLKANNITKAVELNWIPKKQDKDNFPKQLVPSLQELCMNILANHADAITSLDYVPDVLKHKISWRLCETRRMDARFLELLLHGSPMEIRIWDCSWLSEEVFSRLLEDCDISKLMVLQFDLCGACLPDYVLSAALARSPNCLPSLTTISLKCAYRLSDGGLSLLAAAAPCLKSIDISQCSLITSEGIFRLANSFRSGLRELYLAHCCGIDAMLILPALIELENLEVLSVAGIQTVSDVFIRELVSVHGCRMKELILADCIELTDVSMRVIGSTSPGLCAIDLTNLRKLTDVSIAHLANGCQAIQCLKLSRTPFSDEAIAAYLDVCGAYLRDLSLNSIIKVSDQTASSLARNCRSLQRLDLSWCRNLTNEALGLIADSCSSLKVLKLFGCSQVTNVFLEGHKNEQVRVIGTKTDLVLNDINAPDFLLGSQRYPSAQL